MNEQRLRIRVGLFVLGTLILLGVITLLFSNFGTYLKSYHRYTILFDDVTGVGPGTPVRRSGLPIGEVVELQPRDEEGKIAVVIRVDKKHPPRQGDQVTLVRALIGGDASIDFVPAPADAKPVDRSPIPPGTELTGTPVKDARELLQQTSRLVPSTQETLDDIRRSIQRFEKMAPLMEESLREYRDLAKASRDMVPELRRTNDEILVTARNWGKLGERLNVLLQANQELLVKALENFNETVLRVGNTFGEENQRNLTATLRNVRAGTDNVESISKNTDALIKESRQALQHADKSLTRTDDVLSNLQQATKPMAERSNAVMKNLDESTEKLNRTLSDAQALMRAINQADGTLRRILYDPSLYVNLNEAACMLMRTMPRLDRILKDLEVFADKVARHPETLGVGGVVNPSAGLKEAPSAGTSWPHR
jgi:phospholipid/cholesterol/gamma-HCH transport system substrate-binding protein